MTSSKNRLGHLATAAANVAADADAPGPIQTDHTSRRGRKNQATIWWIRMCVILTSCRPQRHQITAEISGLARIVRSNDPGPAEDPDRHRAAIPIQANKPNITPLGSVRR